MFSATDVFYGICFQSCPVIHRTLAGRVRNVSEEGAKYIRPAAAVRGAAATMRQNCKAPWKTHLMFVWQVNMVMLQGSHICVQTLAPFWFGFGSLAAAGMQPLLRRLEALMVLGLAAALPRVLWGSMEGLMPRFMARRRWLTLAPVLCSLTVELCVQLNLFPNVSAHLCYTCN